MYSLKRINDSGRRCTVEIKNVTQTFRNDTMFTRFVRIPTDPSKTDQIELSSNLKSCRSLSSITYRKSVRKYLSQMKYFYSFSIIRLQYIGFTSNQRVEHVSCSLFLPQTIFLSLESKEYILFVTNLMEYLTLLV